MIRLTLAVYGGAYSPSQIENRCPMEVLLQIWDELDDWYGCVRHVWLGMRSDLTDVPRIDVTFTNAQTAIQPVMAPAD